MKLTEKQENCPYCHTDKYLVEYDDCGVDCNVFIDAGVLSVNAGDGYHMLNEEVDINFCPKCGRPLNEEEE